MLPVVARLLKFGTKILLNKLGGTHFYKLILMKNKKKALKYFMSKLVKRQLGKFNYFIMLKKFGPLYVLKQMGLHMVPLPIQKVIFTADFFWMQPAEGSKRDEKMQEQTRLFWEKIGGSKESIIKNVNWLFINEPIFRKNKWKMRELLNHTFWFSVNSPETGNFSRLPHNANIYKRRYGIPMQGEIGAKILRYYNFRFSSMKQTWKIVRKGMRTTNFGREVYSMIRKPLSPAMKRAIALLYKQKNSIIN